MAAAPGDAAAMKGFIDAERKLSGAMMNMRMAMEAYPDLKASQNMMQLSEELTATESRISLARQTFNEEVMSLPLDKNASSMGNPALAR